MRFPVMMLAFKQTAFSMCDLIIKTFFKVPLHLRYFAGVALNVMFWANIIGLVMLNFQPGFFSLNVILIAIFALPVGSMVLLFKGIESVD